MKTMTLRKAALELDDIRNNRTDTPEDLMARLSTLGVWLAGAKHDGRGLLSKLLSEAHELHKRIEGMM